MEMKEMEELFDDGMQSIRMTYYPPCPEPELVVGLTPHSDATGITILHQLNGVEGLEIKKDGVWIPVSFLPDAFVVNVGDIMEVCHACFSSFPLLFFILLFSVENSINEMKSTWCIEFGPDLLGLSVFDFFQILDSTSITFNLGNHAFPLMQSTYIAESIIFVHLIMMSMMTLLDFFWLP